MLYSTIIMEKQIGTIKHYFDKLGVAILSLTDELKVGDRVRIESELMFVQKVTSMEIDYKDIQHAKAGEDIGLKTRKVCASGDKVIRIDFD